MNNLLFNESEIIEFKNKYKDYLKDNPNPYMNCFFQGPGFSVSIYNSGKVIFQGSDLSLFSDFLGINSKNDIDYDLYNTIGADEVGTGDSFGGMVCACSFISKNQINEIKELGIKDSKKLSDDKINKLAPILIQKLKYKVIILDPLRYNELTNQFNMNEMKAIMHNANFNSLSKEVNYDYAVLDEFCSKENYFSYLKKDAFLNVTFEMKGESKSLSVAAASIIARYYFLKQIESLNKKYDINLPKGSSYEALNYIKYIKENRPDILNNIAKMNFKSFN